jgi:hypothetical protein
MEFRENPNMDKYKRITNDSNYVAKLHAYVTATSLPLWDLIYFDRLIFVAQSVQHENVVG